MLGSDGSTHTSATVTQTCTPSAIVSRHSHLGDWVARLLADGDGHTAHELPFRGHHSNYNTEQKYGGLPRADGHTSDELPFVNLMGLSQEELTQALAFNHQEDWGVGSPFVFKELAGGEVPASASFDFMMT